MKNIYVIAIFAAVLGVSTLLIVSEQHEHPHTMDTVYIPSQIAHSLGSVSEVKQTEGVSWLTTDITKVKDQVDYTIRGTVIHVSEPTPWNDPTPKFDGYEETRGKNVKIEIDIEIDEIGKADRVLNSGSIVTVTITGKLLNNVLYLDGGEEQYELGEKVIVHLAEDPNDIVGENVLYAKLGEFGKYKIQDNRAYNSQFPDGRNISSVMSETQ